MGEPYKLGCYLLLVRCITNGNLGKVERTAETFCFWLVAGLACTLREGGITREDEEYGGLILPLTLTPVGYSGWLAEGKGPDIMKGHFVQPLECHDIECRSKSRESCRSGLPCPDLLTAKVSLTEKIQGRLKEEGKPWSPDAKTRCLLRPMYSVPV
jgi:hypothetical protein